MANLSFNEALQRRAVTDHVIIHHSGVSGHHTLEDIHQWHQNRGWSGIGYHYFIDKEGKVFIGRPVDTVGAHAYGYNKNSIGVCFEGDFTNEKMNAKQLSHDAIELLFMLGLVYAMNKTRNNGGVTTVLELNPVTGEYDEKLEHDFWLYCDDLKGYKGAKITGFPKDELARKIQEYIDWFRTEFAGTQGIVDAKRFNDWVISKCNKYGINISLT